MQAEITEIEEKLQTLASGDETSRDKTRQDLSRNWSCLKTLGKDSLRYRLHAELRLLLTEYSRSLVLFLMSS
jgi:hypothetical protein